MKWQVKFLKNSLMSRLPTPLQNRVRQLKRRLRPAPVAINRGTIPDGIQQVRLLREAGYEPAGKTHLELGTGWCPVIPLVFRLAGCRQVITVDQNRFMDASTFGDACRHLLAHDDLLTEGLDLAADSVRAIIEPLLEQPLAAALESVNCRYLAPCDLLACDLPAESVDLVTSRAVLEHIPPHILERIFGEFHRLLKQDGAMCHIIDNSDHREHIDPSICRINFLRYSAARHRLISRLNPLDYQSRWRHSHYLELFRDCGFAICRDVSEPDPVTLEALRQFQPHPDFRHLPADDLAILTSTLVLTKS